MENFIYTNPRGKKIELNYDGDYLIDSYELLGDTKIENIGKVVNERIGFKRVEHIPADGAKSEEYHVSSVQPIHSVFSS